MGPARLASLREDFCGRRLVAFKEGEGERGRAQWILGARDPVGEFNREPRKRARGSRSADHRVVASRKDRADLDEKGAFAGRDRRNSAASPKRVDIPLADWPFELHARAEGERAIMPTHRSASRLWPWAASQS